MTSLLRLSVLAALVLAGCQAAAAPTPQIIYVTPAPTVTASPTASPQPTLTPIPIYTSPSPPPVGSVHTIAGGLTILGTGNTSVTYRASPGHNECHGQGGFSDVKTGMPVIVRNQDGTILGTGAMEADATGLCLWTFAIATVPEATFYSIEAGHRGAVTYSRADLAAAGWFVTLTLGQ